MSRITDLLFTDTRYLIGELGVDGALVNPAVYDTAQVIRMAPPEEGAWPALNWLLDQQHTDGGWGDPSVPRARDVPTLAAVLALHQYSQRRNIREAVQTGLAFLRRQAGHWRGPIPQDIPIGVELVLPALLRDAAAVDLQLPQAPYNDLIALGQKRLALIRKMKPGAGTTAIHSWEAWGHVPDPALFDGAGSIGHSPAATAAWIQRAGDAPDLADHVMIARQYLERATHSTGLDIPGVVPSAWPFNRFEHLFGVYALMMAGLAEHPALVEVTRRQIANTAAALRPTGFSFSDHFDPDGDDTAAGLLVMQLGGYTPDLKILRAYERDNHFCTWPFELQASLSATARAVHTLTVAGEDATRHQAHLLDAQQPDGRWVGDKWNASWLYTTSHVVQALVGAPNSYSALSNALDALLAHQHADGGWGTLQSSNQTETAYAVLTLASLAEIPSLAAQTALPLQRARHWMRNEYRPFRFDDVSCWIAKQMYRPYRVDRAFELSAMLMLELEHEAEVHGYDPNS